MNEQILIYFINFLFIFSIIKGIMRGGTSELVSLTFFVIGFMLAVKIFENTFYRTLLAISLFFTIYALGLFCAYLAQSQSLFEKITGGIMGFLKFFTFLTVVTTLTLLMDSVPTIYKNNFFVSWIYEPSIYIQDSIIEQKTIKKSKN